ncbi:rust resistance kinase Lr10-like isoform X2 [Camellia sinensis]|uniref:rust resistance kinase Lr10-like isoform X2 n=1 Tax=Camellia sinensis TaxID=4442 RepID=UPI0010359C4A|nr:rust resistance kinase Lr10-like isoform X2 [Camellia sinensis]
MFGGKILLAGYTTLVALVLFTVNCYARKSHDHCDPSSCGNNDNITHPFRLKGDPKNCGDKRYELECVNNRTVLHLFSGKYYVEEINYDNHTIRVVDVGIHKDECSSLPIYSLTSDNFSYSVNSPYFLSYSEPRAVVVFMNCENPVKSPLYMDNSNRRSCAKGGGNSSGSVKGQYLYVVVGELKVSDVADLCTVEMMVPIAQPPLLMNGENRGNISISFLDVHNAMAYGFELYYYNYNGFCPPNWSSFHCLMWWIALSRCLAGRALFGMLFMFVFLIYKFRRRHLSMFDNIEDFLRSQNNLMPIMYSYLDIKKMTKGFKDKLGEGGYGCVYKGMLRSGHPAAIKILDKSKANGQDFINEVATIGRIHHVNVVRLIGYCVQRSKRALVYEFMPNGSLEKYIFSQEGNVHLGCMQMYKISLGVARGIDYLHRGCDIQILHFDIKPHNILLDENFTAKLSDFGLAKLYPTNDSIVSLTAARGTMGYMAPELFYKNIGGISYKADVYSFGMLLMEMAGRRRNLNVFADHTSQIYFPSWVYDQSREGTEIEMGQITEEERAMVKKMIIVALWCIQMNPSDRPSMSKVVEMLEGNVELLQMPPKPSLCPQEIPVEDHEINMDLAELPMLSSM